MKCRFCQNPLLADFIDLAHAPPSNAFLIKKQLLEPEIYYPLNVKVCSNCFLVQIDKFKQNDEIFNENYAYFSSFSSTWLNHCQKYVKKIIKKLNLGQKSQVVEIASNDGCLLQYFKEQKIPCLGIEPTANTAKVAQRKGIETIVEFFGEKIAGKLAKEDKKADLIIGNNVLAHTPFLNDFVAGLKTLLKKNGTITLEFPHLLELIKHNQFDTIYHEHYSYFSLLTANQIFSHHGLEIYDVEKLSTHGGSLRIYARHENFESLRKKNNVKKLINIEKKFGLNKIKTYKYFQKQADKIKYDFLDFLLKNKKLNKKITAYGAAAKGNTLLNYCGIKADLIDFVVDRSPHKQGLFLPGSHIHVVDENHLQKTKPDFIIILPWNLKEEIMKQLNYCKDWNAKFVVPIPELEVL